MNDDFYTEEDDPSPLRDMTEGESWLKRRIGGAGDVRIHDSQQAGELVRRLGARAFTAGRDIYVQPELLKPFTRESAALLEHELFHVAEQTGLATQEMPLLRPSRGQTNAGGSASGGIEQSTARASTPAPAGGMPSIQRFQAGQSTSESRAEQAEAATREASRRKSKKAEKKAPPDPTEIADRVYELMRRDLMLEYERGAH